MRIRIDVPESDLKLVDEVSKRLEQSRGRFIREAIATSLIPYRRKNGSFGVRAAGPAGGGWCCVPGEDALGMVMTSEEDGRVLLTRNTRNFPAGASGVQVPYTA